MVGSGGTVGMIVVGVGVGATVAVGPGVVGGAVVVGKAVGDEVRPVDGGARVGAGVEIGADEGDS